MQVLQLGPKIPICKSKYKCRYCHEAPKIPVGREKYEYRYCNETPKFQLVKVSTGVGIATKPQNSSW